MSSGEDLASMVRFGVFEVDLRTGELRKHGLKIKLRDQSFQVLKLLLDRPGQLVTREELQRNLWAGDTFVDFDRGLNKAINRLRAALGDSAAAPQFIETLPKRGYRFIAMQLRFPTAERLGVAMPTVSPNPLRVPSIAVLPFANMSSSHDDDYFSDGLAEEILNLLARIPGLKVSARTSSFAFRGEKLSVRQIAEALGVGTILEGSVRRAGNRIRVTVQIVNGADGYRLWSERYDRQLTDVFATQEEIAASVGAALEVKLGAQPPAPPRHQPKLPAYEAFLKGRHQYFKNTPDAVARARYYFEQAIALDPEYAEPHVGLGLHYFFLEAYGKRSAAEVLPLVRLEAKKALDIFPSDPGAHALLGVVAATADYNWNEAEKHFLHAMAADPVPPEVRVRYALYNLLPRGRFQEAIAVIEKGLEQDPLSVLFRSYLSYILNSAGLYNRAIEEARKSLEIDEGLWATHSMMANSYAFQGMFAEALEWAESAYRLAPWDSGAMGLLAGLYSCRGDTRRAKSILAQPMPIGMGMVFYHLLRSELDAAADWYGKGIEQHAPFAVVWATHSFAKPLRANSHWPALARMINLPEEASEVERTAVT